MAVQTSGGIQASLSGRYAIALFELAQEARSVDAVEGSLGRIRDALGASSELKQLVTSPLVSRTVAEKSVAAIAGPLELDPTTRNFLGVLAKNRRLGQLPQIVRDFRRLAGQWRGETTAEVVSAHPLDSGQVDALKQSLRQRIGREVSVDLSVDPQLLGGLVVTIGSQRIDSSIRTRLNTLAHAMKG